MILSKLMINKVSFKAICGLLVASMIACSAMLYKKNLRLSESLEMAQNNIESYLNIIQHKTTENNALVLTINELKNTNDSILNELLKQIEKNNVNIKNVSTAATQTQNIIVTDSKGVRGNEITINNLNKVYSDSIRYNDETLVFYTITEDSVGVGLDISNTQYLYTYKLKEYKNKKKFFKRLFTLDFKKVWKYKYQIVNTNDLINTSDVRVIEIND